MLLKYALFGLFVALTLRFGRRWISMVRGDQSIRSEKGLVQHLDWDQASRSRRLRKNEGFLAKLLR